MVTKENKSNVLTGNDWLKMAGAKFVFSSTMLRIRLDPVWDVHKDVPIDTDGGMLRVICVNPQDAKQCNA